MSLFPRTLRGATLTFALVAALALPAAADHHEGGDAAGMPPMGPPAEMAKFDHMVGEWDVAMKFRMTPADPWVDSKGKATMKKVLGGCAIREDFVGSVMGMEMHGLQLLSFNRETGEYNSMWMDDMSGKMSVTTGNFTDGKLVMTGEDMQGGMKFTMRNTSHEISADEVHFTMEMSMDGGTNWFEAMNFVYTRAE